MGKTFHSKYEFKKLVKDLSVRAAKAKASRHPGGTRAKGLRKQSLDKIHISDDRNRFGDAYEKSSRMRRIRRYVKHSDRYFSKTIIHILADRKTGLIKSMSQSIFVGSHVFIKNSFYTYPETL